MVRKMMLRGLTVPLRRNAGVVPSFRSWPFAHAVRCTDYCRGVSTRPAVSIGVPVYNGENYLGAMLESVLSQTFTDFEVVVSDNASSDATPAILRDFAARDARIQVHTASENQGAAWNFNRVLELARGHYFKWQAHDDVILPTYLENCAGALDARPEVVLAHTAVDMVDHRLELIEHYGIRLDTDNPDPIIRFRDMVLPWNLCFEVFGLLRTNTLRRLGGMPNFSHGDGLLLASLALRGHFAFVDQPLFLSRQHSEQSMRQFGYEGGGNDYHAYAAWFDPAKADRLQLPNWRIIVELERVLFRSRPHGARVLARGQWIILRRVRQDARLLLADLRIVLSYVIERARRRGASM